ncbi:hypothetical protein GCM10010961_26310 [Pseudodonghicola xiamenensis]|uniref:Bacterial sugar transferase domain-containing protein n=2 Tax=Pseudodonghicola xiamenensis TaxID=337702 RepID=A0A8J3MD70_9RHOB|nr:hypothetical protein GCM10010961_26310 [Pseudodonghicola xiamenensis]
MTHVVYSHSYGVAFNRPPETTARTVRILLPAPANTNAPAPIVRGLPGKTGRRFLRNLYARGDKRMLDLALILLSLPITLPIILLCAVALAVEGGQPFYWQARLGQGGRLFYMVKLRTMVRNADQLLAGHLARDPAMRAEWNANQKLRNDPRITRVGQFLRATSLDELPQLWNVVKGEMSLVGPRPMMPEQLPLYGDASSYRAVKPGITGLWQVSTRNDKAFSYRAEVDDAYYRSLSLGRDLMLMLRTVGVMARRTGV